MYFFYAVGPIGHAMLIQRERLPDLPHIQLTRILSEVSPLDSMSEEGKGLDVRVQVSSCAVACSKVRH